MRTEWIKEQTIDAFADLTELDGANAGDLIGAASTESLDMLLIREVVLVVDTDDNDIRPDDGFDVIMFLNDLCDELDVIL